MSCIPSPRYGALQTWNKSAPASHKNESSSSHKKTKTKSLSKQKRTSELSGQASWYGPGFHGKQTANGERYSMHDMTAAHKTLPFNTKVKVTDRDTGRSVVVRINDRGPYKDGRIIDLSKKAARRIGMLDRGIANVTLEIL